VCHLGDARKCVGLLVGYSFHTGVPGNEVADAAVKENPLYTLKIYNQTELLIGMY
jgi:hypothetical protein